MKTIVLLLTLFITIGGYAVINQKIKNGLFDDATTKQNTPLPEVNNTFKKYLIEDGFTKEDIVQMSYEYVGKYPQAPYPKNLIDLTFREIADRGLNYWGYNPPKTEPGFFAMMPDWAKWALIIGGGIIGAGVLSRVVRRR